MKTPRQSTSCLNCSPARGLTLVEVIAAIAILGTVLVGIVLTQSRHTRQLTRAHAKLDAVEAADHLIAGWWADLDNFPINRDGVVESDARLRWEVDLVENPPIEALGARVVRVQIIDATDDPQRKDPEGEPLVMVDLVLPDPEVVQRELERYGSSRPSSDPFIGLPAHRGGLRP